MASGCYVDKRGLMLSEEWECFVKSNDEFIEGLQLLYKKWDIGYLQKILTLCYVEPEVAEEGDMDIGGEGMNNDEHIVQYGGQKVVLGGRRGQVIDGIYVTHAAHRASEAQKTVYDIWRNASEGGRVEDLIGLGEQIGPEQKLGNQIANCLEVVFYNRHVLEPIEEEVIGMYVGSPVQIGESKLGSGSAGGQRGQIIDDIYVTHDAYMVRYDGQEMVVGVQVVDIKEVQNTGYDIWGNVSEGGRVEDLIGVGEEISLYPKPNNLIINDLEVIFYNRHVLEPIEEEVIGMCMGNLEQKNESQLERGSTWGQIVIDTYVTYEDYMAQQGVKLVKCLEVFCNKDIGDRHEEDKGYGFQGWYERSVIKGRSGVPGLGQGRQRPPPEPPPIMDIGLEEFWLITDGKCWNWCGFCCDMLQDALILI